MGIRDETLLIFDGSCGVGFQSMDLPSSVWGDRYEGCNEYLNLSSPESVVRLHQSYLDSGADVIETNTFGGTRVVLAEYGLEDRVAEINRRAVDSARAAIGDRPGRYVAGSVGPTTKLPSLGHVPVADLAAAYREQIAALVDAGVDVLSIETCQDLLQAKIAVVAAFEVLAERTLDIPVMLSVTMEPTGTMLVGTDIAAVAATFEPFPLFSLGLNCATGPEQMVAHIGYLSRTWPGRISVMPNAGIPELVAGQPRYPLDPDEFARRLSDFVRHQGVSIVGGCCGTTVQHIERLVSEIKRTNARAVQREAAVPPSLASLYQSIETNQEIPPLLIGERMNANGSRKFKKLLQAEDYEGCAEIGTDQEQKGAHLLDVCLTFAGRDELADLAQLLPLLNRRARAPLVIDTTNPDAVAAALEMIPGRCLINSINLEDGGQTAKRVLRLAKKHGAAVIALTIGSDGMAMTADEKLAIAKEIHALAVTELGLRPHDLFIDTLTFTLGSGDPALRDAAAQTLEAIAKIKSSLPGVLTSLGVSNISFGLPRASRKYLNSVFLGEALATGLDAAIVNAGRILPASTIADTDREVCLDLIYNRERADGLSPIEALIEHFDKRSNAADRDAAQVSTIPPEGRLEGKLLNGDKEGLEDLLAILRGRHAPLDIVNRILLPAMKQVGALFGRGEMLLPFVLQSAEVMKTCVGLLEPFMEHTDEEKGTAVVLATVRGDVHDIGKNLVDIILSNNGFRVFNLGINIPFETIIEQARERRADAIGLSGLLVKSALAMQDAMPLFNQAGLEIPVLLGGAALTSKFVAESCAPAYPHPVVYCADAFEGLRAAQELERGDLRSTIHVSAPERSTPRPGFASAVVTRDNPVPKPPFLGAQHLCDIEPRRLYPYLNHEALFRGRWGFKRGRASAEEHEKLINDEALPALRELKDRLAETDLISPAVAYGYFRCCSRGDELVVEHETRELTFGFPRQADPRGLCIADYFKTAEEGGDLVGFMVATVGQRVMDEARRLFENDRYRDYLMLHGFAVELTDALAEHWHSKMREELGIENISDADAKSPSSDQRLYQGARYAFGYPACPELEAQRLVFEMLEPDAIGISLTESAQLVPEVSTTALVVHHPQASYFSV